MTLLDTKPERLIICCNPCSNHQLPMRLPRTFKLRHLGLDRTDVGDQLSDETRMSRSSECVT